MSVSQFLHFSGYTTCKKFCKCNSTNLQINWILHSYSYDFTMTATLPCSSFQTSISGALFPPALRIQRDVGLAGRAAVSIISVTCPARQPAAPPVIRLEFILGLKILDSIWLSADRSASQSVSSQTAAHIPRCQSASQGRGWTSLFVNLFCGFFHLFFRSAAVK